MADFPQDISSLIDKANTQKGQDVKMWDLSLKFLAGQQWLSYDRNISRHVAARNANSGGTQVTVNLLLNIYRNVLARLRLAYPGVVVLPASPSSEDIAKAKASETALRYYWMQANIRKELGTVIEWLLTCGTAALHSYYNPTKDQVETKAVNPYDLYFEPDVPSVEDSQWVAIRTIETRDQLKEAYPDFAEEIDHAASRNSADGNYGQPYQDGGPDDRVEIFEIYWRDGRHAISMGDTYLYQDDQYPVDMFPVQVMKYSNIPGRLWGVSMLAPLVDLQWLYNKGRSQVINNVELMSNPKWLVPKTSGVSKAAITDRPGEKIYYNAAGGAPKQVAMAPLPQYVLSNIQNLQVEMQDVAGVHNISLGKRAIGVTSGKAIQALAQQDSGQLQVTQMSIEEATRDMAKTVLLLMRKFYSEEKMMRMLDATGQVVFKQINGSDLVEDPEIFIEAGSLFRDEAQDRDAKIMEMLQLGLISKEVAMQEMTLRTGSSFITEKVQAISHAKDILEAAKRGFEVEIFRNDDVEAFLKVFGDFMREREYYNLEPEQQEYIRDVYVSLVAANVPPEQYEMVRMADKVFPRKPTATAPPEQQASLAVVQGSETAQGQVLDETLMQASDIGIITGATGGGELPQ